MGLCLWNEDPLLKQEAAKESHRGLGQAGTAVDHDVWRKCKQSLKFSVDRKKHHCTAVRLPGADDIYGFAGVCNDRTEAVRLPNNWLSAEVNDKDLRVVVICV